MSEENENDSGYFWPAYVDFMTVLFFISLGIGGYTYVNSRNSSSIIAGLKDTIDTLKSDTTQLRAELAVTTEYKEMVRESISILDSLKTELDRNNIGLNNSVTDRIQLEGDFLFNTDASTLKDDSANLVIVRIGQSIKSILDKAKNRDQYAIVIEGHTDHTGVEGYNDTLSFARSLSISRLWAQQCGLQQPNYDIISAGLGQHKTTNNGLRADRRIEISITPKLEAFTKLLQQKEEPKK